MISLFFFTLHVFDLSHMKKYANQHNILKVTVETRVLWKNIKVLHSQQSYTTLGKIWKAEQNY